ncbi:MAG: type VI secretion system tip protein VgrG [Melioribacteraceae bacterium]|nr:type VI secretion system tip protein VgrG [Melioribacteraceae bacterium]
MSEDKILPVEQTTDLATFTIISGGNKISKEYHVISITVTKEVNRIPTAKIIFADGDAAKGDFELSNQDLFIPGEEIEVQAGYHNDESTIFKGIIVSHSLKARKNKSSQLVIECRDNAVKMTAGRKNKYYYESKDSDIIEEIIKSYNLSTDIEATDVDHKEMVQFYSTDWDFIVSRAEANGKMIFVNDGKISMMEPETTTDPVLSLGYGPPIIEFEAEMDARYQYPSIKSSSWDYTSQEVAEEEAEEPSITEAGNIDADELSDVLELSEFSQRHSGKLDDNELRAWANSRLLKSKLAKIRGRIRIEGYNNITPGDTIEMTGMGDRFNGKVFVSGVSHQLYRNYWETDIQFGISPDWFAKASDIMDVNGGGLVPGIQGLHIGIVTQLESDPDGEDRVLVKMPLIDTNEEGVWARVATLDAGENRGSFFRPEIGDEVVLGFLNDDPRDPILLGMLNSSAKPAPITASDTNPEKGFVTREDLKLIFNDEKKVITIETPGGNIITLTDNDGAIKLVDENSNKITMDSNGISIESAKDVKIKAAGDVKVDGTNIEIKAKAQFKAEGSAGAEVSSSATATLKGSIVQIN